MTLDLIPNSFLVIITILYKKVAKLRSIKRLFPKEELKMMAKQFLQHQKNKVKARCLKMIGFWVERVK